MPRQGLGVLREQTKQFIGENPVDLVITRNVRTSDGAGGFVTAPTNLSPQTVRLVPVNKLASIQRTSVSGSMVVPDLTVIGEADLDIQRGDTFTYNGIKMQVVWVNVLGYEKTAEAAVF